MARRRLAPVTMPVTMPGGLPLPEGAGSAVPAANVPRAEHLGAFGPGAAPGSAAASAPDVPRAEHPGVFGPATIAAPIAAPIARVAAEAASSAALQELADTLTRARETGRLVLDLPLEAIAPDHLLRDRLPDTPPDTPHPDTLPGAPAADPGEDSPQAEEMAALIASIRAHGQRTPIEVTPLVSGQAGGAGALPYGLVSGWRRLRALKALHAETGDPRFATVQALVRRPDSVADAYVAMVEENEIRVGLSPYERARVAALATARGIFPTEKAALLALFATASRPKRSRIRAFLEIFHALDAHLRFPAALPERLGLELVERLREGHGPALATALDAAAPATPAAELALLARLARPPRAPAQTPASPLALAPRGPVTLETRLAGDRLTLTLTGIDRPLATRLETLVAEALVAEALAQEAAPVS